MDIKAPHLKPISLSPNSPKFIKPFEVFLLRKKKRQSANSPSKANQKKVPAFSPLKCLNGNSPIKKQACVRTSNKSPYKLRKTPVKKSQTENYLPISKEKINKVEVQSPKGRTKCKNNQRVKAPKRQLNFGGIFGGGEGKQTTGIPCIDLINEDTNLEAPTCVKKAKLSSGEVSKDVQEDGLIQDVDRLPIDWSLKTRVRYVSSKPFPWRGNFRASEDATGTTSFVRCLHASNDNDANSQLNSIGHNSNHSSSPSSHHQPLDTSLSSRLRQQSFVWSHPHLPWLSLFPRISAQQPSTSSGGANQKGIAFQIEPHSLVADALLADFTLSIRSLFHLVKTRQCPFFYLCASSFTVLFRSPGIGGFDDIHALITPTTPGFRTLLKEEGITYTMPFNDEGSKLVDEDETEAQEAEKKDEKNNIDHDDEPSIFLESLGLSQQDFPSLQSIRKPKKVHAKTKRQSLVFVVGPDIQLLINFMSNSRSVISNTGPMAAIPPTLLSPVAFHGASLQPLKLKQSQTNHDGEAIYTLDICGPILPSTVKELSEFFRETQMGSFRSNLITHEPTSLFAASSSKVKSSGNMFSVFASESLKDCGLQPDIVKEFCSSDHQSGQPLNEIILNDNIYKLR